MENSTVPETRSRSRSKTPFLRSCCDGENCACENTEHSHKTGRKTPVKRSTPVKQIHTVISNTHEPIIIEEDEDNVNTPPVRRTRQSTRTITDKNVKTLEIPMGTEQDLRRLQEHVKEIAQNNLNYKYEHERVSSSTTRRAGDSESAVSDVSLSPIYGREGSYTRSYNVTNDRSRFSPSHSSCCSTDSSFVEQALADTSVLVLKDPKRSLDHLPSRLYRQAVEYWNKYPKTDYTYSPLSRDRVELAPGQVAVPNMSRRSLSQFRNHGPNTSEDELDHLMKKEAAWTSNTLRKRFSNTEYSDDEGTYERNGGYTLPEQRWWITRLIITIITSITTTVTNVYETVVPPKHHAYAQKQQKGILSRSASALAAPFVWTYTMLSKIVTSTVTTITETVTPNHVGAYSSQHSRRSVTKKRRWWPWLLLLLPIIGYGYYCCAPAQIEDFIPQTVVQPIKIDHDSGLFERLSNLENWAVSVDSKLKFFDQKLSKLDNLEELIQSYSLKYMQQNIVQIISSSSENNEALANLLKSYFDKHYITKDELNKIRSEIRETISSQKPNIDEDTIRGIIQEYLKVFEGRQMEILIERVREYVKEIQIRREEHAFDEDAVKRIVAGMLKLYDADKTGMVDYAMESAGGQVLSTRCTELYQIKTKQLWFLGFPIKWVYTTPRHALTPGALPAECWAFQGFPGYLVVKTFAIIEVTGFSIEHMSKLLAVDGKIESAPKNFSVYGLRDELDTEPHLFGDYMYDENGTSIQYFPVQYPKTENIGGTEYPVAYDIVELRVETNYGNPTYTCVYRFRVHGNPLTDIRRATEDSLRDST